MKYFLPFLLFLSFGLQAQLTSQFKTHWFDGHAEISSYELEQSRYGEQRHGKAVVIFVTEDFLPQQQVKANQKSKTTLPILKSNRTKNFLTGIYPYSIMNSSFSSLRQGHPMLKSTTSIQEWCGQSYLQINYKNNHMHLISHSYFEGEADQEKQLDKTLAEEAIWNLLRINPQKLPTGNFSILPALEFIRMNHRDYEVTKAYGVLSSGNYTIDMPAIERRLEIKFSEQFPYLIEGWTETYSHKGKTYTSQAKRIHTARRKYWQENQNKYEMLRQPFNLN